MQAWRTVNEQRAMEEMEKKTPEEKQEDQEKEREKLECLEVAAGHLGISVLELGG